MRNFLIDSDTASDDAVAIMMALPGSSLPGVREIACAQGFATSVTQAGVSTLKSRMDLLAPSQGADQQAYRNIAYGRQPAIPRACIPPKCDVDRRDPP
jgi:hypothetical protein